MSLRRTAALATPLLLALVSPAAGAGQEGDAAVDAAEFVRLLDVAHDAVLGAFASATRLGPDFEGTFLQDLAAGMREGNTSARVNDAARRLDELDGRAAQVIRHGRAFRHDLVSILVASDGDPGPALEVSVQRYLARAGLALPAEPKNMDVLYDHDAALAFRTRYPRLSGFLWAGQWYRLAVTEPLTDLAPGAERAAGVDTVTARYLAKLTEGDPPAAFPTELPLAPAIAPGLVWASTEAATILDNLAMFEEVLLDILAVAPIRDRAAAIGAAVDFFTDPAEGITDRYEWEIMALRHGIFFQGGLPLAVMTESERNMHSHGMHMRSGAPLVIPGMIGR